MSKHWAKQKYDNNAYYALIARHANNNTCLRTWIIRNPFYLFSSIWTNSICERMMWTIEIQTKNICSFDSQFVVIVCLVELVDSSRPNCMIESYRQIKLHKSQQKPYNFWDFVWSSDRRAESKTHYSKLPVSIFLSLYRIFFSLCSFYLRQAVTNH